MAAEQLYELSPTHVRDVVRALIDAIKSAPDMFSGQPHQWPRYHAAEILGEIGAPAEVALPTLIEAEKGDSDEVVRGRAKAARQKIEKALASPQTR